MYLKEKRLNDTLIFIYKDLKMFKVTFLTFKLNALGVMGEGGGGGGGEGGVVLRGQLLSFESTSIFPPTHHHLNPKNSPHTK